MFKGCHTALITPFNGDGLDIPGLEKLLDFQVGSGVSGVLAAGTTGESPTLSWEEHVKVIDIVAKKTKGKTLCIAGTGSNNTRETLSGTRHAVKSGAEAVLLVDPYYNGPSSLEIRRQYVAPVAREFPDTTVIPYVIPGRTGAQLLPEDIALLNREYANVSAVKEATGNLDNMRRTREVCGSDFEILSGDDDMTLAMMEDGSIAASGVISVLSNIVPASVSRIAGLMKEGKADQARNVEKKVKPLFSLVTVKTTEQTPFGPVECRARNPLAVKTLMNILGLPSGPCRPPLGLMTRKGLDKVLAAAKKVAQESPEVFAPLEDHFGIKVLDRLDDPESVRGLTYEAY